MEQGKGRRGSKAEGTWHKAEGTWHKAEGRKQKVRIASRLTLPVSRRPRSSPAGPGGPADPPGPAGPAGRYPASQSESMTLKGGIKA